MNFHFSTMVGMTANEQGLLLPDMQHKKDMQMTNDIQPNSEPSAGGSSKPTVVGSTVILGDCVAVMKGFSDNQFDLAIVDPPYGLERFKRANEETTGVYAKRGSWKHEGEKNWNNEKPTDEYWQQLFRVSKNQIIWGANNFELPTSEYFLVWDKQQYMPNFASAELAWVSMGLKKPAKVFRHSIHQENANREKEGGKLHPTQKPIKLYEWIMKHYAEKGQSILDTHLGSGSSRIAADKAGLDFTGIEIDKEYFDLSEKRFKQYKSQLRIEGW